MQRSNLHCHTTASDGELSPTDLVALAAQLGVTTLAITDHDTIAGHDEAMTAGVVRGVRVIPGIEVSALSPQGEVHILGYGVRVTSPQSPVAQKIASLREVRDARANKIIAKLAQLGVVLTFAHVKRIAGDAVVGRPHIAKALVELGAVTDTQQAFDRYLGEGKPAFSPHEGLTPAQAIQLIHEAGGVAVFAHPSLYVGNIAKLFADLLVSGLDGIEVYHSDNPEDHRQTYLGWAGKHGLLVTGGSDFHHDSSDNRAIFSSFSLSAEEMARFDAALRK